MMSFLSSPSACRTSGAFKHNLGHPSGIFFDKFLDEFFDPLTIASFRIGVPTIVLLLAAEKKTPYLALLILSVLYLVLVLKLSPIYLVSLNMVSMYFQFPKISVIRGLHSFEFEVCLKPARFGLITIK